MKIVILAGGGGSRLFPLSRTCFPKQFLKMKDNRSLLAQTVLRFLSLVKAEDIVIVTNRDYLYHVQNELIECEAESAHVILEPVGRNTAPAIALAAQYCMEEMNCTDDEILIVAAADHVIEGKEAFVKCMTEAEKIAQQGRLVVFGVRPDKPETGYGYIEAGEKLSPGYIVKSFKEKPGAALAERYLETGTYYWNSGMFAFSIRFMFSELKKYQPQIMECLNTGFQGAIKNFADMPNISIDYAVAEKSDSVAMLPLPCYWNDIGSWDAMYEILDKDQHGNALQGDCLTVDCSNSLIMGRDRLIAGIGLDDLLLVETDDVIVVAKKGESQKVKNIVDELKRRGRKEATDHTTLYRPWGSVTILGEGPRYRMKKLRIKPGGKLSLQMHYHRSEHWIVIAGTARIMIDGETSMVHENQSVFIPQTTKHCLENPGRIVLEIIEVQNGSYVGEDDIVRFD